MTFNPSIPQASDRLSSSQPALLANNGFLDSVYGGDHYQFSDATTNSGKHKNVTTPSVTMPTTTSDPKIYGNQVTANVGVLQFSRPPSDGISTPLTSKIGFNNIISSGTVNILDFSGVTTCMFRATFFSTLSTAVYSGGVISGTLLNPVKIGPTATLTVFFIKSGNILQLNNLDAAAQDIYWSLEFLRIE